MYNDPTKKVLLLSIIHCTQLPQEIAKDPELPQAELPPKEWFCLLII